MKKTVRFCHLAEKSPIKVGDKVTSKQLIGIMGSTGQSTAEHLHIDIVEGSQKRMYRMIDITNGRLKACYNELPYFIGDSWLFGVEAYITTFLHDPRYIIKGKWKDHEGYDVVPCDRKTTRKSWGLHWPRGKKHDGICLRNEYSPAYGFHIYIGYE